MTEDEAKTKWCPFARDSNTAGNRLRYGSPGDAADAQYGEEASAEFPCIGSACMAWRASGDTQKWVSFPAGEMRTLPGHTGPSSGEMVEIPASERQGYCGLAGAPA